MKIQSDNTAPIKDDILGRKAIAEEISKGISKYITRETDGLTIAVTGEWGSGKSTLLSYTKELIREKNDGQFIIVDFNPWLFYKNESLREAFLTHLAINLKRIAGTITTVAQKLNELLGAFRWVKYISGIAGIAQEELENITASLGKQKDVGLLKQEIEALLKKSKRKILVFIDDIDRLSREQIIEIFQTITLVADFSNIVYVVAFDREIVINALDVDFNDKGQDYLEKVIQVDYEVPPAPTSKMEALFKEGLREIAEYANFNQSAYAYQSLWDYHGLKEYFTTIRDIKRFFNSLHFRLPAIAEEINPVDFIIIEAVRIFDYNSYNLFYNYYKSNLRKRELPDAGLTKIQFDELKPATADILRALSPNSSLHSYRNDANMKRLLDPAYFERYFSLAEDENDIKEKDLREIVFRPEVRQKLLQEAKRFNRLPNLFTRLKDRSFNKHYPDYDYSLIEDIIQFSNQNPELLEQYSKEISNTIINLIVGSKKRKELIQSFFQSFGSHNTSASYLHVYFFHYIRRFVKSGGSFENNHREFEQYYKKNYSYIETRYLLNFKSIVTQLGDPLQTQRIPFIKYLYLINYAEIYPTEYGIIFLNFINDLNFVMYLAGRFARLNEGDEIDTGMGDWNFLETLFTQETFRDFCSKVRLIEPVLLTKKEKAIKDYFQRFDLSDFPAIKLKETDTEY